MVLPAAASSWALVGRQGGSAATIGETAQGRAEERTEEGEQRVECEDDQSERPQAAAPGVAHHPTQENQRLAGEDADRDFAPVAWNEQPSQKPCAQERPGVVQARGVPRLRAARQG